MCPRDDGPGHAVPGVGRLYGPRSETRPRDRIELKPPVVHGHIRSIRDHLANTCLSRCFDRGHPPVVAGSTDLPHDNAVRFFRGPRLHVVGGPQIAEAGCEYLRTSTRRPGRTLCIQRAMTSSADWACGSPQKTQTLATRHSQIGCGRAAMTSVTRLTSVIHCSTAESMKPAKRRTRPWRSASGSPCTGS